METPLVKIDTKQIKGRNRFFIYFLIDCVFFIWMASRVHIRDVYFFAALLALIVLLIVQVLFDNVAWTFSYKCSACNKKIDKPMNWPLKDGDKIKVYCPDCNIIWDQKKTYSTD